MKKILSLTLAALLLVSMIPTTMAADQDVSLGTDITVVGAGGEYSVTVPATLEPGHVGTVTASGYWASNQRLLVTAPSTIEVSSGDKKASVNVSFAGIDSLGSDIQEMNIPVDISIDDGGIKFGEWTGTIVYNVELIRDDMFAFTVDGTKYYAVKRMTWSQWMASEFAPEGFAEVDGLVQYNGKIVLNASGNTQIKVTDTISMTYFNFITSA